MKINPSDKPLPTTKVEDDKRDEVSKIKPAGSQQIPDSFEQGKSRTSDSENTASKPAEPVKKAGQRTGALLAQKMTEARLGEAGIKSPGSAKIKDLAGRKDLSQNEQDKADTIKTKLRIDNPRESGTSVDSAIPHLISTQDKFPKGSGNARSNRDNLHTEQMQNFLKEQGLDTPPTSSGPGPAGRPGARSKNAIDGGPTGPGDPLASANARFTEAANRSKQSFDRLVSQVASGISGSDEPTANYGKDMIAEPSLGVDPTPQEIAAAKKKYAEEHPDKPPEKAPPAEKDPNKGTVQAIKDVVISFILGVGTPKGVVLPPAPPDPETGKNMLDGFKAIFESKDRTPETETKKAGAGGGAGMPDPDAPARRDPRLSPLNLPKKPRTENDKDPSPEPATLADAKPNIYGRVGEGMVSQPNNQNQGGSSSGNVNTDNPLGGGAADFEDGSGYHGVKRTQDEADALSNEELKVDLKDDDQEKKNTTSLGDIAKRNKNLISKLKDN